LSKSYVAGILTTENLLEVYWERNSAVEGDVGADLRETEQCLDLQLQSTQHFLEYRFVSFEEIGDGNQTKKALWKFGTADSGMNKCKEQNASPYANQKGHDHHHNHHGRLEKLK
jgi:hypothetical protein